MVLLSQWNVQGIILTYVTKLYFIEVPPTFATPAMDDSLSHRFCPFRPNVNFRNHIISLYMAFSFSLYRLSSLEL